MPRPVEYSDVSIIDSSDRFLIDGDAGTRKISLANLDDNVMNNFSAIDHRNHYRGKNLGTSVSAAQRTAIYNGSFDDLFVGDYWVINNRIWRIADMDYLYNTGDTAVNQHHLIVIPDSSLYNAVMNDTNITTGGYVGSKMWTDNLAQAKTIATTDFGNLILSYRDFLVNAVTDGHPSGAAWTDVESVSLLNEIAVYGCPIFTPNANGSTVYTNHTIWNTQLALFRLNPRMIHNRQTWWLRDVVSATVFARVYAGGVAYSSGASDSFGVRPALAIKGA